LSGLADKLSRPVELAGRRLLEALRYTGGMSLLAARTASSGARSLAGPRRGTSLASLAHQVVRVGARSLGIVALVHLFIGVILALQMAPPLEPWGQVDKVANIIGVAAFRILAPIITAVVLSGFAGASIAAELGAMVVGEEVEALRAIALNPVRFLVVPRVLATVVSTVLLTVLADLMVVAGGYLASRLMLSPAAYEGYFQRLQLQLRLADFATGLVQAAVFALLIGLIACHEGLKVSGGAEGVGRAATMTVVYSIVAIIASACVFTVIFYCFGF
jgi:phospholipid/cholesterol/gamma-HCH transport system permease protein